MEYLRKIEECVSVANKLKEVMPADILSITIQNGEPIEILVSNAENFQQAFSDAKFHLASTTLERSFVDAGEYTVSCYKTRQD